MIQIFRLLIVHSVIVHIQAQAQTFGPPPVASPCPVAKSEIQTECASLGGFVDGRRCYFAGGNGNPIDWAQAWTICENYGATLAQIQTQSEYAAAGSAESVFAATYGIPDPNSFLIALKVEASNAVAQNTTFWYDSETDHHQNMFAMYSFARYYPLSGSVFPTHRCFGLNFRDNDCNSNLWYPVCHTIGSYQSYSKTNSCLTETPVERAAATGMQDCANKCTDRVWCRSFNVIVGGQACDTFQCELFTQSTHDACPNCPTKISATSTCGHYNYDL